MTNTKKILIGKVYANWCGHCISLKPEWKKMKNYIKKNFKHIQFIEAESSEINKVEYIKNNHKVNVKGYPTIFKIKENGELEYYMGERFTKELVEWATGYPMKHRNTNKYMGGKKRHNKTKSKR
jgi:thiol-disulfide isomerase/thioredoxin